MATDFRPIKTAAMQRLEHRLGEPLESWLAERLPKSTQKDLADELGIDDSTLSRYIQRLGLEPRPTGRPSEAVA